VSKLRLSIFVILCFGWIGQSWAGYLEGMEALEKGDYQTALNEFKPLAQQGNAVAQYELGIMHDNGEGVEQNYKAAVKWYRLAAEQGYANAQYNLGAMYRHGDGVLQDGKQALKWYRLAAQQGNARAQHNLGVIYFKGNDVLQNYILGHMWANLAAYNGLDNGKKLRKAIAKKINLNQIAEAQKLAQQCLDSNYTNCGE
jgi:TPR repeat protein